MIPLIRRQQFSTWAFAERAGLKGDQCAKDARSLHGKTPIRWKPNGGSLLRATPATSDA